MNDIQEASLCSEVSLISHLPLIYAYEEIRKHYKQICFTMDYYSNIKDCMSPMMWGHYGYKNKGVCIEFDYDKINIPEGCLKGPICYKTRYEFPPKTNKD